MINGGEAGAALTCQVYCCVSGLPERSPDIATVNMIPHQFLYLEQPLPCYKLLYYIKCTVIKVTVRKYICLQAVGIAVVTTPRPVSAT